MIVISELIENAKREGYNEANAEAKVCQDIILMLISRSRFSENITVKGGVVMRSISNNARRATQDIDLDFIRYSLSDNSIRAFIDRLNLVGDVTIKITGAIEELKQQDYHGKRINVEITDKNLSLLKTKIDLGVHKRLDIVQEEFCFDLGMDDNRVCLLINSKEQMLTEKLRSILKFGSFSTRYKDVFDICYLSELVEISKLQLCFKQYIYDDSGMRENNIDDIVRRVERTFSDKHYIDNLKRSRKNWIDKDVPEVIRTITDFLRKLKAPSIHEEMTASH